MIPSFLRIKDLLALIKPDWHLIALAFVFLLAAAICQVQGIRATCRDVLLPLQIFPGWYLTPVAWCFILM